MKCNRVVEVVKYNTFRCFDHMERIEMRRRIYNDQMDRMGGQKEKVCKAVWHEMFCSV